MTRILWWNTQRLGATTSVASKSAVMATQRATDADVSIYCELTTSYRGGGPAVTPLRYTYRSRTRTRQLCYGVMGRRTGSVRPMQVNPSPTATAYYDTLGFKGGTQFERLVSRAPGQVLVDRVPVYYLHAPATERSGARATIFLTSWLAERYGAAPWLLVGDLNFPPYRVDQWASELSTYVRRPWERTHRGGKELDWVMSNIQDVEVRVHRRSWRWSDHLPIVVDF